MTVMLVPFIGAPLAIGGLVVGSFISHYNKVHGLKGFAFELINPSQIEFDGELVMSIVDAIFDNIYLNPKITLMHVIEEDIVARKQIVFLGILAKITKKDTGCGSSPTNPTIPMSNKFWNPIPTEYWVQECATTLDATFFVWASQKGYKKFDLTDGDFAEFIMERLETAIAEDMLRIAWFNDTTAGNYNSSPAGVITNGVSLGDYNIIDGFWKQIYTAVAADATKRITIAPNGGGTTYALQAFNANDTTNKIAHNTFRQMIENADPRLSETEGLGLQFIVTKTLYNQYRTELETYTNVPITIDLIVDGAIFKALTYRGIPIVPLSFWDRTIKADFNNGTKYYQPHRAVLTIKENFPIGLDSFAEAGSIQQWYFANDKQTNWRGNYKIDAKLLKEYMFMSAY